jgi:type IV secretory pathway VirB10-like protein
MATEPNGTPTATAPIQDQRQKPRGVMPRQLQMWLMVGIAVVMLLIILITGHPQPAAGPQAAERTAPAALPASDRIRAYQQQLKDDEARLQHVQAQEAAAVRQTTAPTPSASTPAASDPIADDQRRREYQSLFADNVALSRRASGLQPTGEGGSRRSGSATPSALLSPEALAALAVLTQGQAVTASRGGSPQTAPLASADGHVSVTTIPPQPNAAPAKVRAENPAPGPRLPLLEGTVIETVLLNRLDGTFAGPVECLVTTPVYSHDRQTVLIPAGARVLGAAAPVQAWGDSRLAVSFHRLVMPDGHTYSLDVFKGLDQSGETGLKDDVNRHYLQVFGASLAIGALSGLAQYGTTGGLGTTSFADEYRQAAGASLATSTGRILDRYLNVLPTITIREGFRIKVYLTNDFDLPAYAATGGVQ